MKGDENYAYDAVVVGSGPNGFGAAITLQKAGLSVLLVEAKAEIGGGMRSAELTLPGFVHDVCSAIHPLAVSSPLFSRLPLGEHGLAFIESPLVAAHPFGGGGAAVLSRSMEETAEGFGRDGRRYLRLMEPLVRDWPEMVPSLLGPLSWPRHPGAMLRFGWQAVKPAMQLAGGFETEGVRGLIAGMAAHAMLPLSSRPTAAFGLLLMTAGHYSGWPLARGGSMAIANALAGYFRSLGGRIEGNHPISSLGDIPRSRAVLLDLGPRQLCRLSGNVWSDTYRRQLERYRYGMGVFKIDWALAGPIPFASPACRRAATVHIGGTLEEIARGEQEVWEGRLPERPFVLLAQQSLFDDTRAPEGKHTGWAYCHVPHGSEADMTGAIERQVERVAPGFKDLILARHTMNTGQVEAYNANYIGGDINGGVMDLGQLFTRPALRWSPYRTSARGIYICSSATPPGGGVHGMCGFHAARRALKDVFGREVSLSDMTIRGGEE